MDVEVLTARLRLVPCHPAQLVTLMTAPAWHTALKPDTRAETNASTRVLAKNGFTFVGEETVPHDGPVWRWERAR